MTKPDPLAPTVVLRSFEEHRRFAVSEAFRLMNAADEALLVEYGDRKQWSVRGYSDPAGEFVDFFVDQQCGGYQQDGLWRPNLRERLECPRTRLNNRQRLVAALLRAHARAGSDVYMMEQVTPIFAWAKKELPFVKLIGSEYLGHQYASGDIVGDVRHEDVENMSFAADSFDLIVSNDVLEHVPHPGKAFVECARVLRPGGVALMTLPFYVGWEKSVTRAVLENGAVRNLLEPVFHGNPIDEKGSLVFTDFGWDLLDEIRASGFADVAMEVYHAPEYGHYGSGLLVLKMTAGR